MTLDKTTLTDKKFWSLSPDRVLEILGTSKDGLSEVIAKEKLEQFGKNSVNMIW